jgi:NAD(P)H-hydrate epimerase
MLTLRREDQKRIDQTWVDRTGLPLLQLMEEAAVAVCRYCLGRVPEGERNQTQVLVLAGKGQNGGDAYACARLLAAEGFAVRVSKPFPAPNCRRKRPGTIRPAWRSDCRLPD